MLNYRQIYLRVDAVRIGDASSIASIGTLVDVDATLSVEAGVVEADALNDRSSKAGRTRVATEACHHVVAAYPNVARIG